MIRFHKEGYKIIVITFIISILGILLAENLIDIPWLVLAIKIIILIFLVIVLQFFRNPKRIAPLNDNALVAPVDGKVVVIEEVEEPEYFKGKRLQVSIFMSPINVHVTRYAMSDVVVRYRRAAVRILQRFRNRFLSSQHVAGDSAAAARGFNRETFVLLCHSSGTLRRDDAGRK